MTGPSDVGNVRTSDGGAIKSLNWKSFVDDKESFKENMQGGRRLACDLKYDNSLSWNDCPKMGLSEPTLIFPIP